MDDRVSSSGIAESLSYEKRLSAMLKNDAHRWNLLGIVRDLELPDCWIGGGFIRDFVWNSLNGRPPLPVRADIDVIWFAPDRLDAREDLRLEAVLRKRAPGKDWSVKNQARMHLRNGDEPYASSKDAMRCWTETATAVAARRLINDTCEISAPFGLDDLFNCKIVPGPRFTGSKRNIFEERLRTKAWLTRFSHLRLL